MHYSAGFENTDESAPVFSTEGGVYSFPLADVQPSTLVPGTWNLYVRYPVVHLLSKHDTEDEANDAAKAWCDKIDLVLKRSRSLPR